MLLKLLVNPSDPPPEPLIVAETINSRGKNITVSWCNKWTGSGNIRLCNEDDVVLSENILEINRYLGRVVDTSLYGDTCIKSKTEIDHWLTFALGQLDTKNRTHVEYVHSLIYLNKALLTRTWLCCKKFTLADIHVYCTLWRNGYLEKEPLGDYVNLTRWYKHIQSLTIIRDALIQMKKNTLPKEQVEFCAGKTNEQTKTRKQEGKFIDLPGAEMGKVVVRFPPEASGYLHIGHAKAALLNQYYAEAFKGKFIMRFDDTNPAKETTEFEEAILEDLRLLQIKPDQFTHTSDYFDILQEYCTKLIKEGKAYVDDTPAHIMKEQREQKLKSENRDNPVGKNLALWEEMRRGTEKGQACCVRAKIDYESTNGCMRDPTIYRCKLELHPYTQDKYKVYPTYDFACPIVDSIENVTHTLRTTEYHDRDAQFYWVLDALGLRRPHIWEYSRLNMTHTVLSKRKLTWFVNEGLVDGWNDPRFPTVRGILRRGMTVEGLKQFIIAQGSSRSVVFMEWDKIWAINKKVIDSEAFRYTALDYDKLVPVHVLDAKEGWLVVQNHPKHLNKGFKNVITTNRVFIEDVDAMNLVAGQSATFINWGNLKILEINKRQDGSIIDVHARLDLDNRDYKNTLKITWLVKPSGTINNDTAKTNSIPCYAVYFDHIISVPVLGKDDDFKDFVAKDTRKEVRMLGEVALQNVKKGEIIQIQRKGYFICDVPYAPLNFYSSRERPLILFHIPDGHMSTPSAVSQKGDQQKSKKLKESKDKIAMNILENIGENSLYDKIKKQSKKFRLIQNVLDEEQRILNNLQAEYKTVIGHNWISRETTAPTKNEETSKAQEMSQAIQKQGDKVRNLKSSKAEKSIVDEEVKILLSLKTDYKNATGQDWKPQTEALSASSTSNEEEQHMLLVREISKAIQKRIDEMEKLQDWKPGQVAAVTTIPDTKTQIKESPKAEQISDEIQKQGDKVRNLKSSKAEKSIIDEEVKILLSLKNDYKKATGQDWKPGQVAAASPAPDTKPQIKESPKAEQISDEIQKQGDKVRNLKSSKTEKSIIDQEVKILLSLKNDYKKATGQDWKPGQVVAERTAPDTKPQIKESPKAKQISDEIEKQGDKVRNLKSSKTEKSIIDQEVKILLSLKNDYKNATGQDWKPAKAEAEPKKKKEESPKAVKPVEKEIAKGATSKDTDSTKTGTRLGLEVKKDENFFDWYSQIITKSGMIEYYDVSGCYILRPWSFAIWKIIKDYIDQVITLLGVHECYFPIFVTRNVLEKEKTHIADFAPEVAWVTKCGESDLAEPIAIRPTSETIMYPAYAKWLKSDTELPLRLNQWNNVVRWEFKDPKPFLRTREFLWQEGHTAFATKAEAEEEVLTILNMYGRVYEDILAVPVIKGRKTEKEKFAGGDYTTTVEAFISTSGRAIQGATSHHLGQNFSKMFNIQVEGVEGDEKTFVYQNSWGLTTRTIGVMIMVHGDDKGLVLPPKVASIAAVVVPCGITASTTATQRKILQLECMKLVDKLQDENFKVHGDFRNNRTPGWKFNHWELKGVPVRIELGPKDLEKDQVTLVRRDTSERSTAKSDEVVTALAFLLNDIQTQLFRKARKTLYEHIKQVENWNDFAPELNKKNLLLSPFCGEPSCEERIKADSAREESDEPGASMGAKSLCIPFDQPELTKPLNEMTCIHHSCTNKPKFYTLFGRSY
ncbi:hypothetical protein DMN91_008795 [Ooceraea biroi]|uniref:Bifunctional glutamate/proline--tRNA ligase n=1 Tax=Ooceraea biroi TaxID=2015173 RepID=A0A3L8DEU5_OOCBI|nr:bifunctional glutamate/proline--tRNA ligase [Ooceraea biroi]RLU18438.1 hypothetical protein DMN91_008795 [Ooceraea biroi]